MSEEDKEEQDVQVRVNVIDDEQQDYDKPTMLSFVIVEGFKWGIVVVALYVVGSFAVNFLGAPLERAISFLWWLFSGEEAPPN